MMTSLTWTSRFRIALLITDAPNHGSDYNMGCGDNYKDEKLDYVLEMIMDKSILLYGIKIFKWTELMYTSIKNVFFCYNIRILSKKIDPNIFIMFN